MNILPRNKKPKRIALTERDQAIAIIAIRFYTAHTQALINDITSVIGIGNITLKMEEDVTHAKTLLFKLEATHG